MPNTVIRFDADTWVVIHLRPHSDVVQVVSNFASDEDAERWSRELERQGGHVFEAMAAGTLVGAIALSTRFDRLKVKALEIAAKWEALAESEQNEWYNEADSMRRCAEELRYAIYSVD